MSSPNPNKKRRPFRGRVFLLAAVVLLAGLGVGLRVWKHGLGSGGTNRAVRAVYEVRKGPLTINVVESGSVRPREQIILKNDMEDRATILSVVDEGTQVKKGDLLVELDATSVEDKLLERRMRTQNNEAQYISSQENMEVVKNQAQADAERAELDYRFSQEDLKKYQEGDYPKLVKEAEAKITLAKEEGTLAQKELEWSQVLYEEKYLSESDLKQDELAAKRAELDLELAQQDLELLKNYTYKRRLAELESNVKQTQMALERTKRKGTANIAQAEARLKADKAQFEQDKTKEHELERELTKAKIYAPIDGIALYASSVSTKDWDERGPLIDEGASIDERGEIIYLPTTSSFNVDVRVQEVSLNKIRVGLPGTITVDALPGKTFTGRLTEISPVPDSSRRYLNPDLKVYNTVIEIDGNGAELRNGMSCKVDITVDHYEDAIYVPIQCVVRIDDQPMVYVLQENKTEPRPVEIGLDNNQIVHVLSGLREGEAVLLEPPLGTSAADAGRSEKESPKAAEEKSPKAAEGKNPETEQEKSSETAREGTKP